MVSCRDARGLRPRLLAPVLRSNATLASASERLDVRQTWTMDSPDPDAPAKSSDRSATVPRGAGWRRLSLWLGLAEIMVGVGLSLKGCASAVDLPPVPLFSMMFMFIVPNLAVTLPGVLLVRGAALRWVVQILPLLLLVWMLAHPPFGWSIE